MNAGAPWPTPERAGARVLGIQRKLHKWATTDQDRRFCDLHNLVCDPSTLLVAWRRVRGNRGSRSAGVDGRTAYHVEQVMGVEQFLSGLREQLNDWELPAGGGQGTVDPKARRQKSSARDPDRV